MLKNFEVETKSILELHPAELNIVVCYTFDLLLYRS